MPKFFCDYCDVYLTHDSMSVRKAHNSGRNHLRNVIDYYQQIGHEKAQSVIDSITNSWAAEGQASSNPMMHAGVPGAPPPAFAQAGMPPVGMPPGFPAPPGGMPPGFPPAGMPPGFPPGAGRGMPLPNGFPPAFPAQNMPFPPSMPGQGAAGSLVGMPFAPPGGMPSNMSFSPANMPPGFPQSHMSPAQAAGMGGPPGMPPQGPPGRR